MREENWEMGLKRCCLFSQNEDLEKPYHRSFATCIFFSSESYFNAIELLLLLQNDSVDSFRNYQL
jgi:hypothetical protein